jgi:hypothetical protein
MVKRWRMAEQPVNETVPSQVTVAEVHAEFEKLIADRTHMGVRNFLGDTFLEPRNPFQRARRRLKRWVIATSGMLLLAFLIAYYFHIR